MPAGSLNVPAGSQVAVVGSYSSAVETWAPPTTRTRPLASGVAVTYARGVAMLAVAVQAPVVVLEL
jgi:hypothetical protein